MNYKMEKLMETIVGIAPNPYLQAILIILLFYCVAKIFDMFVTRFIRKWVEKTSFALDDKMFDIFHKPVFISIILFGLSLATERLELSSAIHSVTLSGLKTVVIFVWAGVGLKFMKVLLEVISRDSTRFTIIQDRTLPLFNNILMILIFALSIYFVFLAWNIDVTAWMASAGILGLAISFAAKDTLANLFSGVFIVADAPYKLGDFIVLDSGERGAVTNIGIRSTRLLTRDDVEITVPNSIMGNAKITNETGGPHEKYRIRVKIGVAYGSDIEKVHDVLLDEARQNPQVCRQPEPRVRFRVFGDSSLDHELLCWVKEPVLRGRVLHNLNTAIYKRFLKEGIEIPFPQQDIYIRSSPHHTV